MLSKVSVIIVNWNGERLLEQCLSALLTQTFAPHEIILVDNASSDGSLVIARHFPSIRLLAQNVNLGFAGGNNLAVEATSNESEWIVFLNPDAFVEPNWLEALMEATHDYPSFDVFGSKLVNATDPSVLDGAGDTYHISGRVWRKGKGKPTSSLSDEACEVFSTCAAATMYRRNVFFEMGGFDEDFFCFIEDVDLGFRVRLAGYRCLYVPSSIAHHVGSGTTGGRHSDFSIYHGHRNLVWTYVKDMPGILFWLFLPLHLIMNLVALCLFTIRGHGEVILRAKKDALLGLPKMWAKRRIIQRNRVASLGDILRVMTKGFK